MGYLSRKKIYHRAQPDKNAKKIYIFCEGEKTEIKYFEFFQGFSSNIDIIPIPPVSGKTDPTKLKDLSEILFFGNQDTAPKYTLSKEYKDEIWFVIDTDRWNEGNKIQQLKDFCTTKNLEELQWFVAQSNPCIEIWLYYHFNDKKPEQTEVSKHPSFKNFVHNNTGEGNGFNPTHHPIEIERAIRNSKLTFEIINNQPGLFSTEVYYLGEIILSFIHEQLVKAKAMSN